METFTMWSWILTFLLAALPYIGYQMYKRYKCFQLFKDLGIAGPLPSFISGNMEDVRTGSKLPVETMMRWQQRYGKVYGYFKGSSPVLVVADLELMKRILIKDIGNFMNRPKLPWDFKAVTNSLLGLRDDEWRAVRKSLTPTFSASKMKQLTNVMNRMVSVFCSEVDKIHESNQEFEIYDRFQRLTLEVIGECALAMQMRCQTDPKDFMFQTVQYFMRGNESGRSIRLLFAYFPWLSFLMKPYYSRLPMFKMVKRVLDNLVYVIETRRGNPEKHKTLDVLQLMLDAGYGSEVLPDEEVLDKCLKLSQRKPLTDDQIVGNCWIFLLAGFETTATALAFTVHCLVNHPDVQDRVVMHVNFSLIRVLHLYKHSHNLGVISHLLNNK